MSACVALGGISFVLAQATLPIIPDKPDRQLAPKQAEQPLSTAQGEAMKIDRVFPQSGPPNQFVSIEGSGFGPVAGTVVFDQNGRAVQAETKSFPLECQGLWWRNTTIIVKVPQLEAGTYMIKLKRQDGSISNQIRFVVNQGTPTPGICGLLPDNGPAGVPVRIFGSGFGRDAGKVVLGSVDLQIEDQGWNDSIIRAQTSLTDSLSGKIRVITADKTLSNPISFSFARCSPGSCGTGNACCADGSCRPDGRCEDRPPLCTYSWAFYTGDLAGTGEPCSSNEQCLSGICTNGICAQGIKGEGARCTFDAECQKGLKCENGMCKSILKKNGDKCTSSSECFSGKCENGICKNGDKKVGEQCKYDQECASGNCYNGKCAQARICPKVLKSEPTGKLAYKNSVFSLLFNQLMDEASVRAALLFRPETKGSILVKVIGTGLEAKTQAEYRPDASLKSNEAYTFVAGPDARSASSPDTIAKCAATGGNACSGTGSICDKKGSLCEGGASCSGNSSTCRGVGTVCSGKGSKCLEGATCTGTGSTCLDKGSSCTNEGSVCRKQAGCSGLNAQCGGSGVLCTGNGSICKDGAVCKGTPPIVKEEKCETSGQKCSAQGAQCTNGSTCSGVISRCTGIGAACEGNSSTCLNGAVCDGSNSTCSGVGTLCTGSESKCVNGARCTGVDPVCQGAASECTGDGSVCSAGATCNVLPPDIACGANGTCPGGLVCNPATQKCIDPPTCGLGGKCPEGLKCNSDNKCYPACGANGACPGGLVCNPKTLACTPPPSCENGKCPNGLQCNKEDNKCYPACAAKGACPAGLSCNGSNLCGLPPTCGPNGTCPNGGVCSKTDNRCYPECGANGTCPGGLVCNPNTKGCEPIIQCGIGGSCPAGYECEKSSNQCKPIIPCGPGGSCPGGKVCVPGTNTCIEPPVCGEGGKCPDGLECNPATQHCYPPCGPGGSCPSGLACKPGGTTCEVVTPIIPPGPIACNPDGSCPLGTKKDPLASSCKCLPDCSAGQKCPAGSACDSVSGVCRVSCPPDSNCRSDERCVENMCRPIPTGPHCGDGTIQLERGEECDNGSSNNSSGNICTGSCKLIACGPKGECPGGSKCSADGKCHPVCENDSDCKSPLICDPTEKVCKPPIITVCSQKKSCEPSDDCKLCEPLCTSANRCKIVNPPDCASRNLFSCQKTDGTIECAKPCPSNDVGVCSAGTGCSLTDDCKLCPKCATASRCSTPPPDCKALGKYECQKKDGSKFCSDATCEEIPPGPIACNPDGSCPLGTKKDPLASACTCLPVCASNTDCPANQKCDLAAGVCRVSCPPDSNCRSDERCVENMCKPIPTGPRCGDGTIQLERGEECDNGSSNNSSGNICTGSCKLIACGPKGECPGGSKCSADGKCHPVCENDSDCKSPLICDPTEKVCKPPIITVCSQKKSCEPSDDCKLCEPLCTSANRCKIVNPPDCASRNLFSCQKTDGTIECAKPCPSNDVGVCSAGTGCSLTDDCKLCPKCATASRCSTPPPDCKALGKYECQKKDGSKFCSDATCEELPPDDEEQSCGPNGQCPAGTTCNPGTNTCQAPGGPQAPSSLILAVRSSSQIDLTWSDNSSNERAFLIYRSLDKGASYSLRAAVAAQSEQLAAYADTGLDARTEYTYKIIAINAYGDSDPSNVQSETTSWLPCLIFCPTPAIPTGLDMRALNASTIKIIWNHDDKNVTAFKVERTINPNDPDSYITACSVTNTQKWCNDGELSPNTTYWYRVQALNGSKFSAPSEAKSIKTLGGSGGLPPLAPTQLTAVGDTPSQITLQWQHTGADELGFNVYRTKNLTQPFEFVKRAGRDELIFIDTEKETNVQSNSDYWYRVAAFNDYGETFAAGDPAKAHTPLFGCIFFCKTPVAPTEVKATKIDSQTISLSWQHTGADLTAFRIEKTSDSGATKIYHFVTTVGKNERTHRDAGLLPATYSYRITALNDTRESSSVLSGDTSITTVTPPQPGQCVPTQIAGAGLRGIYYAAEHKDPPSQVPAGSPLIDRIDSKINFDWRNVPNDPTVPPGWYLVRWTGGIRVPQNGEYTFHTRSDDGIIVSIDNKLIINNWTGHGITSDKGKVTLEKEVLYPISMTYYENGGYGWMQLFWSGPGVAVEEIVPTEYLYTDQGAPITTCVSPDSVRPYLDSVSVLIDDADKSTSLNDQFNCTAGKTCPIGSKSLHTYSLKVFGRDARSGGLSEIVPSGGIQWGYPTGSSAIVSLSQTTPAKPTSRQISALANGTETISIRVSDVDENGYAKVVEKQVAVTVSASTDSGGGGGGGGGGGTVSGTCAQPLRMALIGFHSNTHPTYDWIRQAYPSVVGVIDTLSDASMLAEDNYDIYIVDRAWWSADSYNSKLYSLWNDRGKNVISIGNDSTSALDPIGTYVGTGGAQYNLASKPREAHEVMNSSFQAYDQIGAVTDGYATAILTAKNGFTSLYERVSKPAGQTHHMGLIGKNAIGGIWFHDNTGGLFNNDQGKNVLTSVLDYMTKDRPSRSAQTAAFKETYSKQVDPACALGGNLPLESITVSVDGAALDDLHLSDQFNCSESYPCPAGATPSHTYSVTAFGIDAAGTKQEIIPDQVTWSLGTPASTSIVLSGVSENTSNSQAVVTAKALQGGNSIAVTVQGKDTAGNATTLTKTVTMSVCPHPWSYVNADYDFSMYYCRDIDNTSMLPLLSNPPRIRTAVQGFIGTAFSREYIFPFVLDAQNNPDPNQTDVIIMRVGDNPKRQLLNDWYKERVPFGSPSPIAQIDGFDTLQDESGIYVMAPSTNGTTPELRIYFFAVNKGADPSTTQLFTRMLSWTKFASSIPSDEDGKKLRMDMTRYARLRSIQKQLEQYRRVSSYPCKSNPSTTCYYPNLDSGSYISHESISIWPSWKQTLSNNLGTALPVDPLQEQDPQPLEYQCSLPFNKNTCWYTEEKCGEKGKCSESDLHCETATNSCFPYFNGSCEHNAKNENGYCKPQSTPFQLGTTVYNAIEKEKHVFTYKSLNGGQNYQLCGLFDKPRLIRTFYGLAINDAKPICFEQEPNLSLLDRGMLLLRKISSLFPQ